MAVSTRSQLAQVIVLSLPVREILSSKRTTSEYRAELQRRPLSGTSCATDLEIIWRPKAPTLCHRGTSGGTVAAMRIGLLL